MPAFTVVVLYPERLRQAPSDAGLTYVAHVEATNAEHARGAGAKQAFTAQSPRDRGRLSEWLPLVVFAGHHEAAFFCWQTPAWKGAA